MAPEDLAEFLCNEQDYPRAIGPLERLRTLAVNLGGSFFKGTDISKRLYAQAA